MARKVYTNAFAGGEQSPLMFGHIEDQGYQTGYAAGTNMLVLPTGAARKRPQFEYVATLPPADPEVTVTMLPFAYGDGDSYAMAWGPTFVRLYADGDTLRYATPIPVESVDLSADAFTTVDPHGLSVNEAVRITHKGTSIPGSLLTGDTYYVNSVVSPTSFTLSATPSPGLSLLNLTTNSTIDETSFWKQSELPREYIPAQTIVSVDSGAESIEITAHPFVDGDGVQFSSQFQFTAAVTDVFTAVAHGLVLNVPLRFELSGAGALPGGVSAGVTYYVQSVPTPDTFTISALPSAISALDITSTGSGVQIAVLQTILVSTPAIAINTTYYVSVLGVDDIQLHTTKAAALAGTGAINIASIGGGFPKCDLAYYSGDIVWAGQLTLLGTTSSRLFWCRVDLTRVLPTVGDWFQMPADGTYELQHGYGGPFNYDQSLDVFSFCSPTKRAGTLSREIAAFPSGSSATVDVVKFVFRDMNPAPGPAAPVLSLSSRVFGEYYNVSLPASPSSDFAVAGTTNHALLPGDVGYLEGSIGAGTAMAGVAGSPGFFLVTTVATNTFKLRRIDGAAEIANTGGASTGAFRLIQSSSTVQDSYLVTALADNGDESIYSNEVTATNALGVPGSSNVLAWTAVTGAQRYRLYKKIDGAFGLIAETTQLTIRDDGIPPDLSIRPPVFDDDLVTEFPRAVANFQQRPWFGGTNLHPRRVWGGKTGTLSTMSYHDTALLDTDRIRFDVAARERTLVRHIVPSSQLWVLTSSAEIKITGQNTDVLSPAIGIDARPLSQIGCTGVRPIVANSNILFVGARNGHVYEMPSQTAQIVDPPDMSTRAAHLFDGKTIVQSAQQDSPVPIEWWLRSDGTMLGLTYMPEQNISGWHLHTPTGTDAGIESFCVIPDNDGQRLYALVTRTINGARARYIERMGRIADPTTLTACKFLDSCITYTGTATTTVEVQHLIGQVVYVVADGKKKGPFTVPASGIITLDVAATTVHAGLLYAASLRTLPPAMLIEGYGKGVQINVKEATLRVDKSCGFTVKVVSDDGIDRQAWPATGIGALALTSKDISVPLEGSYGRNGQIEIEQSSPFPLTIVSLTLDVDTGGP